MNELYCDGTPYILGLFDPSYVPQLLWYAYVPITVIALVFGVFLLAKDRFSLRSWLFFGIALLFSLNLVNETLQWVTVPVAGNLFAWHLTALLQTLIYVATFYFAYVFTRRALPNTWINLGAALLVAPVLILLPTHYNIIGFDVLNCEGLNGYGWLYFYGLQALITTGVILLAFKKESSTESLVQKQQRISIVLSAFIFLAVMLAVHVFGDLLGEYVIYLAVSLSMAAFIGLVTHSIVAYRTFNIGLIAAQALIFALIALIGSQFFFVESNVNRILISVTLVLTAGIGLVLIRSVKKEIEQRVHIEKLAKELEAANGRQVSLIHFITHQIKGFVTKSRNIFAGMKEGDFGALPDTAKPMVDEGFSSDTKGLTMIQDILNAANIKSGNVEFKMEPFDLKALIEEIVASLKPAAEQKGLEFTAEVSDMTITGDRVQLANVFKNVIDNAIKYTPSGKVSITLQKKDGKAVFVEEDTGVGITKEDMEKLFTEGGHGVESKKVNVESTGFGLYIAKSIVEKHNGHIKAESEGEGKGSRFTIELPEK